MARPDDLVNAVRASDLPEEHKQALIARLEAEQRASETSAVQFLQPEVAARIEAAEVSVEGRSALRAVAVGVPFPEAVQLAGAEDRAAVWRAVQELGLIDFTPTGILDRKARIATLADARIEARLLSDDKEPSIFELNAVSGTATDKLIRTGHGSGDRGGELRKLLEMLQQSGGGQVTLGYQPSDGREEKTIDVESDGGAG